MGHVRCSYFTVRLSQELISRIEYHCAVVPVGCVTIAVSQKATLHIDHFVWDGGPIVSLCTQQHNYAGSERKSMYLVIYSASLPWWKVGE